jgi:MFS family permease
VATHATTGAGTAARSTRMASFGAFRHRDFRVFWIAALVSNSGTWMQQIAVPLVLFQITGRSTWVGIASFATLIPALVLSPVAGILADRYSRQRILIVTQIVMMAGAFALWGVWVAGAATPGRIVALLAVNGICSGLQLSSWQSFVPMLVPREAMLDAVRLNSMQFNAARAFGPAAAGLVLGTFGPGAAFLTNAVTYLFVIAALLVVRPREVPQGSHGRVLAEIREGVRYVRARPGLRLPVLAAGITAMIGLATVSAAPAPFAEDVFHVGEGALGALVAMVGLGGIVGSVWQLAIADRVPRSRSALLGFSGYVAGVLLLGVAPSYWVGLCAMAVIGTAHVTTAMSINTTLQAKVHEEYRGRALSLYLMALFAGAPIGALVQGVLGDEVGRRASVLIPGAVFALWIAYAFVRYHRFRDLDGDDPDEGPDRRGAPPGVAPDPGIGA